MAKKDSAKAYLEAVLKTIPEDKRAAVAAKVGALDDEVLDLIGDGVMLKSDYTKGYQALSASKEELDDWYEKTLAENAANAKLAAEYKEAMEAGRIRKGKKQDDDDDDDDAGGETLTLKKLRESMVTKDEGAKIVQEAVTQGMQGVSILNNAIFALGMQHLQRFGEVLNPQALLEHARKTKAATVEQAYQSLYAEKIQQYHEKTEAEARKKLRDELRAEVVAELKSAGPYPIGGEETQMDSGSALSGLKDGQAAEFSVNAAADDYMRRVAARGANA